MRLSSSSVLARAGGRAWSTAALVIALAASTSCPAAAQQVVRAAEQVLTLSKGASLLLRNGAPVKRFSIGDPTIAEAVAITPAEILINGKTLGTTTLLLWDGDERVRLYSIEVTPDAEGLQRNLKALMPDDSVAVAATGGAVTLTGRVSDASAAARAVEIAKGSGATVIDNITTPIPLQVMLEVRFAEMSRNALHEYNTTIQTLNPHHLSDKGDWKGNSDSFEGLVQLGLFNTTASIDVLLKNLQTRGEARSLAEPNLMTLPGKEAYFLAGGEFPFPVPQSGTGNTVTIVFKEFGIKLRFTPTITRSGSIRMKLAPEVSSLDFSNALIISGFRIPSLLTRRAETEVELREGEHLSIAGLVDNTMLKSASKIPLLGDIPILGAFFRSKQARADRTQLIVIVTPRLVRAGTAMAPVPTGEPNTWPTDGHVRRPMPTDSVAAPAAPGRVQ